MVAQTTPGLTILTNLLNEFSARLSIDGSSRILVTDATVARHLVEMTRSIATPYGPKFTIASAEPGVPQDVGDLGPNVMTEQITNMDGKMDHFTHAVTDVSLASGRTCMDIMKWAKYALKPKGILVVVALKQPEEGGKELADRLRGESKGRVSGLGDVLEYAGFERGKIKVMERNAEVYGKAVEAEVVLAMKWDQLTA
ncbi:hypothetical protein LTR97_000669 [Elasticomyces elasticus]|uniref:Uncharacterized protein n=1 Tax=Elasticomyces elasticus TaxID=574655 RepID=A0AAN7VYJ9_9PEZI|nr:hypothetical protein LTR97_000669 [Elasticomyces elasticus]